MSLLIRRRAPAATLPVLLLTFACATSTPPPPRSHIPPAESGYVLDPVAGFPMAAGADLERRVSVGWDSLRAGGGLEAIRSAAEGVLAEDPGFHPARVLLAQLAYLGRDLEAARELLQPVADELPEYLSCQILLGRTLDLLGDPTAAFRAYSRVETMSSTARDRLAELYPVALALAVASFDEALGRGHVEEAERQLVETESWAAGEPEVLAARRCLAAAQGDHAAEIEIVRRLLEADPTHSELREDLGDLMIVTGDVRGALGVFQQLADEHPEDPGLLDKLEGAKFLRRLSLLPSGVREIASKGELDRAEYAALLYWLVPEVRYAEVENPPIATDILDHPRRDEVLRVMNLGLIEVDETLHLFSPAEPMTRLVALRAMLRLLVLTGGELTCLSAPEGEALAASRRMTCGKAAQCGLLPEESDCLPQAVISGHEALELFRATLNLLASG